MKNWNNSKATKGRARLSGYSTDLIRPIEKNPSMLTCAFCSDTTAASSLGFRSHLRKHLRNKDITQKQFEEINLTVRGFVI